MSGKYREPVTLRGVLVPVLTGIAMGLAVFAMKGGFSAAAEEELWLALCDALAVPGILLTGTGLLSAVSSLGAFDGISFPARKAFSQVFSEKRRDTMPRTYYDYVAERRKRRGKKPGITLYAGLGFLALAIAALGVYLSVAPM